MKLRPPVTFSLSLSLSLSVAVIFLVAEIKSPEHSRVSL
jgi:hypothetical protein